MRMRLAPIVAIVVLAFIAGFVSARLPQVAHAAAMPLQPAAIDLTAIAPDAMPTPGTMFPNLHSKTLVVADGMTAACKRGLPRSITTPTRTKSRSCSRVPEPSG
jgi:hypothetical protein